MSMNAAALYYMIFETAFGPGAVFFTIEPLLFRRVLLPRKSMNWLTRQIRNMGVAKKAKAERARGLCYEILEYFRGKPISPPWEHLDLGTLTPLQICVLRAVAGIPYGQTRTYADIARQIGRPRAYRFVGMTMSKNPFPIIIPCHRVIRSDGSPGGFGGGVGLKRRLLALEKKYRAT